MIVRYKTILLMVLFAYLSVTTNTAVYSHIIVPLNNSNISSGPQNDILIRQGTQLPFRTNIPRLPLSISDEVTSGSNDTMSKDPSSPPFAVTGSLSRTQISMQYFSVGFYNVPIPELDCLTDEDCRNFHSGLPLVCQNNHCTCNGSCWHYQFDTNIWNYIYSCSECGTLGSTCSNLTQCITPGVCGNDHFCHCLSGENFYGICLIPDILFMELPLTIGMLVLLGVIIIAYCGAIFHPSRLRQCLGRARGQPQYDMRPLREARRAAGRKAPAYTYICNYTPHSEQDVEALRERDLSVTELDITSSTNEGMDRRKASMSGTDTSSISSDEYNDKLYHLYLQSKSTLPRVHCAKNSRLISSLRKQGGGNSSTSSLNAEQQPGTSNTNLHEPSQIVTSTDSTERSSACSTCVFRASTSDETSLPSNTMTLQKHNFHV